MLVVLYDHPSSYRYLIGFGHAKFSIGICTGEVYWHGPLAQSSFLGKTLDCKLFKPITLLFTILFPMFFTCCCHWTKTILWCTAKQHFLHAELTLWPTIETSTTFKTCILFPICVANVTAKLFPSFQHREYNLFYTSNTGISWVMLMVFKDGC